MARITHYASYLVGTEEVFGTAELLCGSGWLFRRDGQRQATVVSYKDANLMLSGWWTWPTPSTSSIPCWAARH